MKVFRLSLFHVIFLCITFQFPLSAQSNLICDSDSIYHQMNFRIGKWELKSNEGDPIGIQIFEKILDGCAIKETYESHDGSRKGSSITYYDRQDQVWKQTFADNQGNWTEGKGKFLDGNLVFESRSSRFPLIRWTVETVSKDQLKSRIEVSYDGHYWEEFGVNSLIRIIE